MDFKKKITDKLKNVTGLKELNLEKPPSSKMGDFAYPCFELANIKKRNPKEIAEEIKKNFPKINLLEKIEVNGPYINFYLDKKVVAENILKEIIDSKGKYGKGMTKKDKIMVEFSQANTHKAFHVGHLRGTSLGESLSRIYEHDGFNVVRANYQGDTGMHVAKWLWCYFKFHKTDQLPKKDIENWIAGIYVEAVKKIRENEAFEKEAEEINIKLDNKTDKDIIDVWKKTRNLSLDAFKDIYKDLDVKFDKYFFEGDLDKPAKEISKRLLEKKIAKIDQGAIIIDMEKYGLGVWVLLRKDGTPLYSAKDIALAEKKFKEFKILKSIYVVGAAQTTYLKQLFMTLGLMGFKQAKKCQHLPFSEVRFPEGKMSSRTGENVLYSELKKRAFETASREVKKRHPEWTMKEMEKSAFNITIGAIKFEMLKQDPNKNIIFDVNKSVDFEGETGPYIQYSHARICSILRKSKGKKGPIDFGLLSEEEEKTIILELNRFTEIIQDISKNMKVNNLANYTLGLSQLFNEYYHKHKVLTKDRGLKDARITLVECVRQVLSNCLYLMGIPAPEKM